MTLGLDPGSPTTLVLLRHGETALTPGKRLSGGGSDPALSETGRRQAADVAQRLATHGTVQAVVSSPLRRCRQTAEAAARRLGLEVQVEEGLREADFGNWEGLTFAEVRERCPDELAAWRKSPTAVPDGSAGRHGRIVRGRDTPCHTLAGQAADAARRAHGADRLAHRTPADADPAGAGRTARFTVPDGAGGSLGLGGRVLQCGEPCTAIAERHITSALSPLYRSIATARLP